jgi:hypothetical protein
MFGDNNQRFVTSNNCQLFRNEYRWLDHRLEKITEGEAFLGAFEAFP